jgi:outer membrane protein OmpA-like peptidoglycan-associated protein
MKSFQRLLVLVVLGSLMFPGFSQEDDKYANYRKRDHDQLDQYESGDYLFPPKPKSNWSVGLKGGYAFIAGDVRPQPGFGGAFSIRKPIGHSFSLRLEGMYANTKGLNYVSNTGYLRHSNSSTLGVANNNPWDVLYSRIPADNVTRRVFYNFSGQNFDLGIQGLFNINNINFYKEQNKWNVFLGAGVGVFGYGVKVDALSADGNIYNFDPINALPLEGGSLSITGRNDRVDALKNLLDGEYETQAEFNGTQRGFGTTTQFTLKPSVTGVLGLRYRVNRRVELELEHRAIFTGDDLLDGQRWSDQGTGTGGRSAATTNTDLYNMTSLGIHFRIGKGQEALYWTNPLTEVYTAAQESRQMVKKLSDDSDGDGILDFMDKEPDTPEGAMVDAQGRTLDSDGDGVADHEDDEPFSPKGAEVGENGRAMDRDNDGVADIFDKEPNSPPGMYYDAKGVAIVIPSADGRDGADGGAPCLLPILHFDLDKDNIKPEFYPELYYIAQVMKADPKVKVKATGYADNRNSNEYNLDLSRRRVTNAVDFICNSYGIDKSRFIVDFKGEDKPLIDLPDARGNSKLEPLHYVNRRVEFECVK